jgi:hypothetical protein
VSLPGSAQHPSQEAEFLNVLLSFAQFEREVIGERIRDKIAAKKRGMWRGRVRRASKQAQPATMIIPVLWISPGAGRCRTIAMVSASNAISVCSVSRGEEERPR